MGTQRRELTQWARSIDDLITRAQSLIREEWAIDGLSAREQIERRLAATIRIPRTTGAGAPLIYLGHGGQVFAREEEDQVVLELLAPAEEWEVLQPIWQRLLASAQSTDAREDPERTAFKEEYGHLPMASQNQIQNIARTQGRLIFFEGIRQGQFYRDLQKAMGEKCPGRDKVRQIWLYIRFAPL
jgi:hypothetical protein